MYRLLARLWLSEVDENLLQNLLASPLRNSFVAAGGILPATSGDQTVEQLSIDYCQLFIGPTDHLPPYQSVWQFGQFQGTTTVSMKRFIQIAGYDSEALPSGIILDHLGVQLDVMGHVLDEVVSEPSNSRAVTTISEIANSYFAIHLRWPAELLAVAERRATTEFYRSVIEMTREFLDCEWHVR